MDFGLPNFFGFAYNEDQLKVLALLKESKEKKGTKLVLMSAPAFVVDFDYKKFVPSLKALGFDKVTELTFGAKIINTQYHKYIHEHYSKYERNGKKTDKNFQDRFISSVCPASVELIKNKFPQLKKYLLPFDSPMGAMSKVVRKNFPKHKIVFLAPCFAKKLEARELVDKKGKKLIEGVVTFSEMKQVIAKEKPKAENISHKFDSFYNDYTKIYPLAGGLCGTLHYQDILEKKDVVSCDGVDCIQKLFSNRSNKVFYDILFCKGGCIGGPGVATHAPLFFRKQRVLQYIKTAAKEKMDNNQGLEKYTKGIDFTKTV
ncbi:MAG: [Fe-Fe] hydrogenase large subunit C-terminal domain-containing protein [archaeon]|jgi:iron only hydrogenase large subunit-like protein